MYCTIGLIYLFKCVVTTASPTTTYPTATTKIPTTSTSTTKTSTTSIMTTSNSTSTISALTTRTETTQVPKSTNTIYLTTATSTTAPVTSNIMTTILMSSTSAVNSETSVSTYPSIISTEVAKTETVPVSTNLFHETSIYSTETSTNDSKTAPEFPNSASIRSETKSTAIIEAQSYMTNGDTTTNNAETTSLVNSIETEYTTNTASGGATSVALFYAETFGPVTESTRSDYGFTTEFGSNSATTISTLSVNATLILTSILSVSSNTILNDTINTTYTIASTDTNLLSNSNNASSSLIDSHMDTTSKIDSNLTSKEYDLLFSPPTTTTTTTYFTIGEVLRELETNLNFLICFSIVWSMTVAFHYVILIYVMRSCTK